MPTGDLRTTLAVGDIGHVQDHEELALLHNGLLKPDGTPYTAAQLAALGLAAAQPQLDALTAQQAALAASVSANTAKSVIAEAEWVGGLYNLASSVYTPGTYVDFPNSASGVVGNTGPLQVSFPAPASGKVRLHLEIPGLIVQTADATGNVVFRARQIVPGTVFAEQLTVPLNGFKTGMSIGGIAERDVYGLTPGTVYTYTVQAKIPTGTATFLFFAINDANCPRFRVSGI